MNSIPLPVSLSKLRSSFASPLRLNQALDWALRIVAAGKTGRGLRSRTIVLLLTAAVMPLTARAGSSSQTVSTFTLPQGVAIVTQAVSVPIATGGTLTNVSVVTQGASGLDFTDTQTGDSCVVNNPYSNTTCSVNVQFQPKAPGRHFGAVVLTFGSGSNATYAVQYLYGFSQGPLGVILPGLINTVAGTANFLYSGDGVPATSAPIQLPLGEVMDAGGNLYLSDSGNYRIRKVDTTGTITTYVGNGDAGSNGDGLPATSASITTPSGLAIDGEGNLYFADRSTNEIRMVDANTKIISVVAGMQGVAGYKDGPVLQAELTQPNGIAIDSNQNLYLADTGNNVIRMIDLKVDPSARQIVTIAGTQTPGYGGDGLVAAKAIFNQPWGINLGPDGDLYIADVNNNAIRRIDPSGVGATVTVAGQPTQSGSFSGDGGPASKANLQNPEAVAVDLAGNIYIADTQNNRIRKATVQPGGGYLMSTIAGGDSQTFFGDGGNSNTATMSAPSSLALDGSGNLYFGDLFHNRVRMISSQFSFQDYGQIKNSHISPAVVETFENDGNGTMTLKPLVFNYSAVDNASTCPADTTLAIAVSCTLDVEFAPQVPNLPAQGAETPGSLVIPSDAANSPGTINLRGDVLTVNPTTTTIASSGSPSAIGVAVTFTTAVSNGNNGPVTGTVTFLDGQTAIGSGQLDGSGNASFTTTTLALGQHSITASYGDDANNAPSVSPVLTQVVKYGTTLAVVSSLPNGSTYPQSVTFTATLSGAGTPVGGSISFSDGAASLGSFTPSSNGSAALTITSLAPGQHTIVATFSGDTNNLTSSNSVAQNVALTPTSTLLTVDSATVTYGAAITLQATVSSTGNPPAIAALSGSVTFMDGVTPLGSVALPASGIASLSVSGLTPGKHSITAVYSGDSDNQTSKTSSPQSETVNQITTTTGVSSSLNPANAGAQVSLTATVAPNANNTAGGPITGTVTFFDGSTQISIPQTLVSNAGNGIATISVALAPGSGVNAHNITATYNGATNYAGSTSPSFTQNVTQNTTNTTVSSIPGTAIAGKAFTLNAFVKGLQGSPTPTGTVDFMLSGKIIGSGNLNSSGEATFSNTILSTGQNQVITATYSGDTDDATSFGTLSQNVTIAQTQLTLTSSAPSGTQFGNSITFTADLTGTGGQPNASVTFLDGTIVLGSKSVNVGGSVALTTNSLPVGPHNITATYAGDTDDSSAISSTVIQQVNKLPTSVALASSANPGAYGKPITFVATITSDNVAPTGLVTFQNGANVIGTAQIIANGTTSGTATLTLSNLPLGTNSIAAVYAGDANHINSQSNSVSQQVLQPANVGLTSSNPSSIAETNVTLTANVAGVQNLLPTGNVTFKDGATVLGTRPVSPAAGTASATGVATLPISTLTPGTHSIVASYSGDTNYQPGSSPAIAQTVIVANTSVSLVSSANPATFGTALTFTSNVSGTGGSVTGAVTFMDGPAVVGKTAVNSSGVATLTTTTLAPGQHTITAVYSGDVNNQPNTSSALQQRVQQTTMSAIVSSVNPAQTLSPIVLTCAVSNGGAQHATGSVTFTDGSTLLGTAALDGNGLATISLPSLAAGQHNVVASYSGDVANFPSASAPFAQIVQLRPTTDVLTATTTSLTDGKQLTLISVIRWSGPVTPTGTVNFTIGSTVIGTATVDNIGVATLTIVLDPGAATIVSSYSGDSVYAASKSPATAVSDGPPTSFTLQLSNSTPTLHSKQNITVDLTIASLNGFTDNLTLGCLGLPFAASCTFSATQPSLQPNTTQTVHVVIDTSAPLLAGTQTQASGFAGGSRSTTILALSCSLLLGLLLMRSRKRHPLAGILVLLCSIALVAGLSGCGTLNINGTPTGTYTFKVTASGIKTGITQSADVTLTVQQ